MSSTSLPGHFVDDYFDNTACFVLRVSYPPLPPSPVSVASVALEAKPAGEAACRIHSPSAPPSVSSDASYS